MDGLIFHSALISTTPLMQDISSVVYGILGGLVAVVTTAVTVANYLNGRFSVAEAKISVLAQQLAVDMERLRADLNKTGDREMSHWDMAEYRINACTELINHRTQRFKEEIERLERHFDGEVNDVKGFLEKTTEFKIRSHERP